MYMVTRFSLNLRQQTAPLRKKISQLESQMEKLSDQLAEIEQQLSHNDLYSPENKEKLTAVLAEQVNVKQQLETIEMDWLGVQEELESCG
ncbi:putative ABC transporter ATP-binding protein [Lonepinella sp. MS14435]